MNAVKVLSSKYLVLWVQNICFVIKVHMQAQAGKIDFWFEKQKFFFISNSKWLKVKVDLII